jgi:LysR family glycine cleavage system transcriptional activator
MKRTLLPLTALRAFEVAARQSSLRKACAELGLTAGAVSQQVRALEKHVGVQLFDRTSGRYKLTTTGAQLAAKLTFCFDGLESALQQSMAHTEATRLRIKLAPTFAARWMAPRLESFFSHNPGVDLEVTAIASSDDMEFEQCDFLVRAGSPPWPDMDHILLFREVLVPVCSPSLGRRLSEPKDLIHHTLLHSAIRSDDWSQWLRSAGMDPAVGAKGPRFPNALLASEAAASGAGVAIMQEAYIQSDLAQGRLVAPLAHRATSKNGYYMTSIRQRRSERKIRNFSKWIRLVV